MADAPKDLLDYARETCASIKDGRDERYILGYLKGETKELEDEVDGADGKDGVFGEAVDVAWCALDMMFKAKPDATNEEIIAYFVAKGEKWKAKSKPLPPKTFHGRLAAFKSGVKDFSTFLGQGLAAILLVVAVLSALYGIKVADDNYKNSEPNFAVGNAFCKAADMTFIGTRSVRVWEGKSRGWRHWQIGCETKNGKVVWARADEAP